MMLKIKVEPTENTREWRLLEAIWYKSIKVPEGFVFDGASIPVGLRWLFPHGGRKFFAAAIHDYAYRTGCCSKEEADQMFLEAMLDNGSPNWGAKMMYYGVHFFGEYSWNKHRRKRG